MSKLLFKVGDVYSGVAGGHQFTTIWTRDFCHAIGGILQNPTWKIGHEEVKSKDIVLTTLKALFNVTESLGEPHKCKIPRALDWFPLHEENALTAKVLKNGAYLKTITVLGGKVGDQLSSFPRKTPLQGYYAGEDNVKETTDAGYLMLRGLSQVVDHLSEEELGEFLATYGEKVRMAVSYYSDPMRFGAREHKWFFKQSAYTEWKDSCKQAGMSSYSNLQLIQSLSMLFKQAKKSPVVASTLVGAQVFGPRFGSKKPYVLIKAEDTAQYDAFEEHLTNWTQDVLDYFYDPEEGVLRELATEEPDEATFAVAHIDANLQWLETNKDKPELRSKISLSNITKAFIKYGNDGTIGNIVGINKRAWPINEVSHAKKAIGLYQYHGTFAWSWWSCWASELAAKNGNATLAKDVLGWVWKAQQSDSSLRGKDFHKYFSEIYDGPKIAQTLVYVSETPFLWGSSYCLRAANALKTEAANGTAEGLVQQTGSQRSPGKRLRQSGKLVQGDESAFLQEPLEEEL